VARSPVPERVLFSLKTVICPLIASLFRFWHDSCTNEGDRGDVTLTRHRQEIPDGTTNQSDWKAVWSLDRSSVCARAVAIATTTVHLTLCSGKPPVFLPMPYLPLTLFYPMRPHPISITTKTGTRHFETIKSAAKAYRIHPLVLLKRLRRGWSPEQAVGIVSPPPKPPHYSCKPVTVRSGTGVRHFASIKEAAAAYGVHYNVVSTRLRSGWTKEQALGLLPPPPKKLPSNAKPIAVTHNGRQREFKSIGAAARAFNLRPQLVHKRWKTWGWPLEEALGIQPHARRFVGKSKPVRFVHKGRRYQYESILAAAVSHDVHHGTVLSRLSYLGWSIQQALGLSPPPGHSKFCYGYIYLVTHRSSGRQYVGQTLLPVLERWEEHVRTAIDADPNGPHFRCAIREHGRRAFRIEEIDRTDSFHDANAKERKWIKKLGSLYPAGFNLTRGGSGTNLGRPLTVRGVRYQSISEAARAHGLSPFKVASRLNQHSWTAEQALGLKTPPPRPGRPIQVEVEIKGKNHIFSSIKAASDALGKDYSIVRSRAQTSGWKIDQALDLTPPPARKPSPGRRIRFSRDGRTFEYSSLRAAATEHGVDSAVAGARINKLGWTYAQALGVAPPPKKQPNTSRAIVFSYGEKNYRYESIQEAANAHGLKGPTAAARIRKMGWTYAQALGVAPPPDLPRRPDCAIDFTHSGKLYKYNSISHAAIDNSLKPGTVASRLRSGHSIQQALGLTPPPTNGQGEKRKT